MKEFRRVIIIESSLYDETAAEKLDMDVYKCPVFCPYPPSHNRYCSILCAYFNREQICGDKNHYFVKCRDHVIGTMK